MKRITANATHDDLTDQDYRDIYAELRTGRSLRQFIGLIDSQFSPARWSQWEAGARPLSRAMRQELRQAVNRQQLPPTVDEVMTGTIDPDAEIWQLGQDEAARRVLLIAQPGAVTVHWNGSDPIEVDNPRQEAARPAVTGVTRRRYWRPTLPLELQAKARTAGLTAADVRAAIERAIAERE